MLVSVLAPGQPISNLAPIKPLRGLFLFLNQERNTMRLTKTIRDAFVRAAMDDVPKRDYQAEIHKLIQDDALAQLPPKVRAIADDKNLRHFLRTESHYISGMFISNVRVMHPEYTRSFKVNEKVEALLVEFAEQHERNNALRTKLAATADAVSTRKALVDLLPEFEKYLPADEAKAVATLPAVANVLSDFVKAGWPKNQPKMPKVTP